jgi:hypothetical protein
MQNFSRTMRLRLNSHAWALVILVIIEVLISFLSDNLTIGRLTLNEELIPHKQIYNVWLGITILCLLAVVVLWILDNHRWLRMMIFLLNGLFTVQLLAATLLIIVHLLQSTKVLLTTLMMDGFIIFVTNVLVFSLWYWYIDSTSTRFLDNTVDSRWDFLFPQRQAVFPGYENWLPRFWDYVFLAFTTSVSFSPTDTLPLSLTAKLLVMTQSIIALIAITAVVGTAINILAGRV